MDYLRFGSASQPPRHPGVARKRWPKRMLVLTGIEANLQFIEGQKFSAGKRAKIADDAALLIAQCGDIASLRARVRASIDWPGDAIAEGEEHAHWTQVAKELSRRLQPARRTNVFAIRVLCGVAACLAIIVCSIPRMV